MTVKEVDGVRIDDGHGVVTAIDRRTKNAQVSIDADGLKFAVKGWVEIADLNVIEGDQVVYERHKELPDGFPRFAKLARASSEGTSAPGESQRDQTPNPPGRDDTKQGEAQSVNDRPLPDGVPVPNTDTQRFEGYAFLAACGMVDLAYEELSDAKNAGTVEKVTAVLVRDVAAAMLAAADAAQREVVGAVNRNAMSHTRARGAVRSALRSYPYEGETVDWGAALTRAAVTLLQVAASL